jgi:hypothetical protein
MPQNLGSGNEPAITNANVVLQTILGPPFCWRWNRAEVTQAVIANTRDVTKTISDFGFLERASYTMSADSSSAEINLIKSIGTGGEVGPPAQAATQSDNGSGSLTFRVNPAPDAAWTLTLLYQKKASLFTALSGTWSPIPDEFSYIYQQGFLGFTLLYIDDPRFVVPLNRFFISLVGAAEGLSETERSMFLAHWQRTIGQMSSPSAGRAAVAGAQ